MKHFSPFTTLPQLRTSPCLSCIVAAAIVLAPFSMIYHLRCAFRMDTERVENNRWRKLDQSAQLVAAVLLAAGLSEGHEQAGQWVRWLSALAVASVANMWFGPFGLDVPGERYRDSEVLVPAMCGFKNRHRLVRRHR